MCVVGVDVIIFIDRIASHCRHVARAWLITCTASSQVYADIMPNRHRHAKAAAEGESPLQRALAPILARLDTLEGLVSDIIPDNAERTVDRCAELEATCRQHFNNVMGIAHNQRVALSQAAREAQERCDKALKSLAEATLRHTTEATAMRAELGELKGMLEQSAQGLEDTRASLQRDLDAALLYAESLQDQCTAALQHGEDLRNQCDMALSQGNRLEEWKAQCDVERKKCEAMLRDVKATLQQASQPSGSDILVNKAVFRAEQAGLQARARSLSQGATPSRFLRAHYKRCQELAASRSPSRDSARTPGMPAGSGLEPSTSAEPRSGIVPL